ncbi:MAG TPA: SusC/RagA family TonB-linked outer membrane protein [Longimicrobiaceae bacterium]|nr:SusC/RagA family TonB-linked outer membrane protein [Longimicrobiaceae bacterium]
MGLAALCLLCGPAAAAAQQRQITGTVTGANGRGLSGAFVAIAASNLGVRTDVRGGYSISVPAGDVRLRVRSVGYKVAEINVPATQATANFSLIEDVLNLQALVVTGQATAVARQNVANDVAVVGARELQRVPAQTIDRALQGKVAGATIRSNSGAPGGGVQIRIRGASSITGNATPLYVVDGVVISDVAIPGGQNAISRANTTAGVNSSVQDQTVNRIADLNPNDIENIEILKGASAAAIYGSRASAGVVVITTKRGQAGRPRFSLSQRVGFAELSNEIGARDWTAAEAIDFGYVTAANASTYFNPDGSPKHTYDLEKQVFGRRAPQRETTLSVSGGNEGTQYYISGLLMNDQGIAANTGYEKQSLALHLNQALSSRIHLNVGSSLLHSVAARGITGNDNTQASYVAAISATPNFFSFKPVNGVYPRNPFTDSNPLETSSLSTNDEDVWRAIGSLNLTVDLLNRGAHSLKFVGIGGADYFTQDNRLYFPPTIQLQPFGTTPGTAVSGGGNNLNLTSNLNLVHAFTPRSGSFSATTSVGVQYQGSDLHRGQVTGRNLLGDLDLPYFGAAQQTFGRHEQVKDFGGYAQEELLMFDEHLSLTGGLRADRSSNNSDTEKYFFYPKVNGAFTLPGSYSFLDQLKLRAAYGSAGNEPLYGQKFTALNLTNIENIPTVSFGTLNTIGALDLHPERTTEIEGGFDATLLGERALLTFTAYHRNITDLLLSRVLAPSSGYFTEYFNGGKLSSNGIEASIQATPLRRGSFQWVTNNTFSRNRVKIVELPVEEFSAGNSFGNSFGSYRIRKGFSPTTVFANFGRDATGAFIVRPIGESEPDFQMGFNNDFKLRRFSLSTLLDWSHGGKVVNLTRNYFDGSGTSPDFLMPSGVTTPRDFEKCGADCLSGEERLFWFGNPNNRPVYVEDASFVKLREVSVSYEVPARWLGSRVSNAQISLSGRNLKTWTGYSGYDPEVSNFGNVTAGRNQDVTPFPPSRTFWLAFNVGF